MRDEAIGVPSQVVHEPEEDGVPEMAGPALPVDAERLGVDQGRLFGAMGAIPRAVVQGACLQQFDACFRLARKFTQAGSEGLEERVKMLGMMIVYERCCRLS